MKPLKWKFGFIGNMGRCSKQELRFLLFFCYKMSFFNPPKKVFYICLTQSIIFNENIHTCEHYFKTKNLLDNNHKMT